jgi:hypothetical protein
MSTTAETATAIRSLRVECSEKLMGELRRHIAGSRWPSKELSLPVAVTVFPGEITAHHAARPENAYPNLVYVNEAGKEIR